MMSANEFTLEKMIESSRILKKEDDEIGSIQSYNESVLHIDEQDAAKIVTLENELGTAKQDIDRLKVKANLDAKAKEEANRQAEFYKKAYEAQALIIKQQAEQLQAVQAAADAKSNAAIEARVAAERLAAQQIAILAVQEQQSAALRVQQQMAAIVAQQGAASAATISNFAQYKRFRGV